MFDTGASFLRFNTGMLMSRLNALMILRWYLIVAAFLFFCCGNVHAQQNDSSKIQIHILKANRIVYNHTDSGDYHRFIDSVVLQQGTDTLFCDSAYQNNTTKNFEAFSNVRIVQTDGTQGNSDYLRYTSNKKLAFMRGNVSLTDGKNNLRCEELTYDLATKTGVYDKGGVLHNDSTTVTSNYGLYNVKNKEAHFTGHVVIIDPQYKINSEDVVYNTETKITRFYAQSTVVRDSGRSILITNNGYYDGKNGIAHFIGHARVWSDGQYIEADTLDYNKQTGIGIADGHVISIDTAHHSTMYCGHADYNQKKRTSRSSIKPVLVQVNGKDTLYIRADTFYSAPMEKGMVSKSARDRFNEASMGEDSGKIPIVDVPPVAGQDFIIMSKRDTLTWTTISHQPIPYPVGPPATWPGNQAANKECAVSKASVIYSAKQLVPAAAKKVKKKPVSKKDKAIQPSGEKEKVAWAIPSSKKEKSKKNPKVAADTAAADSTAPLYFIGYHHVLIFSDSLQGRCDSISYTRSDSTIRMMYDPVAWSHSSQITGDTILMFLDSSELRGMYVPEKALVVSQSGPEKAQLFDQVQGKTLTAWFTKNAIDSMLVVPEAETIYYSKDEHEAYLGVNQAKSDLMRIYFSDQKIKKIKFVKDVHQTMTPMEKADLPATKLSRFKWLIEQRPKTKEELFK
jgi:lipopolysaccharide export system protein LptA